MGLLKLLTAPDSKGCRSVILYPTYTADRPLYIEVLFDDRLSVFLGNVLYVLTDRILYQVEGIELERTVVELEDYLLREFPWVREFLAPKTALERILDEKSVL